MDGSPRNLFINIGYGNLIYTPRIVAILAPTSNPMKRLREDFRSATRLIDATSGRKTRSVILTDSHHLILSALIPETVAQRIRSFAPGDAKSAPENAQPNPERDL